ncbi:hypothetical protein M0P65_05385 [Candidatus Gracilibacteria bacterium]|nr:hypothetical protein [Candidatus Gracilibacteria bacterium]
MIGYKATINGYCLNQLYEVGETYTLDSKLIMCEDGFHFYQDLYDIFEYYPYNKNIKVFKVEPLGETINHYDKYVTNKLKILEEVDLSNMVLEKYGAKIYFDNNRNLIKKEYSDGFWIKCEYDSNNNLIRREYSDGFWAKWKYDSNNNLIKLETSNGFWRKYEYDSNNNFIKEEYGRGQ